MRGESVVQAIPPQTMTIEHLLVDESQLAEKGARGIFLVKPQFEVGKEGVAGGGIVRDSELALQAAEDVRDWLDAFKHWKVTHFLPSPITGGDGNQEYLLAGEKNG